MKIRPFIVGAVAIGSVVALSGCSAAETASKTSSADNSAKAAPSVVYTQTNGEQNEVLAFTRSASGKLKPLQEIGTGGAGTDGYNPILEKESTPDSLFSAGSVQTSPDGDLLFVTNAGDDTVTSFRIADDGKLSKISTAESTANGSYLKSLSYDARTRTLFALHTFGPEHLTAFSVAEDGTLTAKDEAWTANTAKAKDRVAVQTTVSPDGRFVLVQSQLDNRPKDGELDFANDEDKDALIAFPIEDGGRLGEPVHNDAGGPAPFSLTFLHGSDDEFVNAVVGANGLDEGTLHDDGSVTTSKVVEVDLSKAPDGPSETCWVALTDDNRYVYASNYGLGTVAAFERTEDGLELLDGTAASEETPDDFRAFAGVPTSGPADNWMSDDDFLYQLYPNADKLVGYEVQEDGSLEEVTSVKVPHNSTMGLAGI